MPLPMSTDASEKRILIVSHYFHPDSGAAAIRLSRLARILSQRGHQVRVLTTMPHYPVGTIREGYRWKCFASEQWEGVSIHRSWLWATPSKKISRKMISQLSFMIMGFLHGLFLPRPDVILVEAQPIFTGLAGKWLARLKRCPYVLNVSDLWPDHLLSVGALKETSRVYRLARSMVDANYRHSAGIVAMSEGWAEKIRGYIGNQPKTTVVYNGVDLQRFVPRSERNPSELLRFREAHGLVDKKIVAFVGTFATQYDFEAMLETAQACSDLTDVRFLFIGTGSQRNDVDQWIQRHQLTNVQFIDWLPHEQLPTAWAAMDMAFWAMRPKPLYEGTIPAKLFETLATGTPIVAAHGRECRDLVQRAGAGMIVSPGQTDQLITAVRLLIQQPEKREAMSLSGRQFAEAHLDAMKVADRYEAVLQEAAS